MRPGGLPQPGAERQRVRALQQRLQCLRTVDAMRHQFRPRGIERTDVIRARGDADQASSGTQGGFAGQVDGAGHALAAADHQQMAVVALVGLTGTGRQHAGVEQLRVCHHLRENRSGHPEGCQFQHTHVVDRTAGMQAPLVRNEGHRDRGTDRRAGTLSGVGIHAGGNIQRQDRHATLVDAFDQPGDGRLRRAIQADAVQRVHLHVGFGQAAARVDGVNRAAAIAPRSTRRRSVALRGAVQGHDVDLQSCFARKHAEQETVAAIVARAAVHADPPR